MLNIEIIYTLLGLVGLLFLDTLLGMSLAIKNGSFSYTMMAHTLKSNVLPYVISLGGLGAAASFSSSGPAEAMTAFFLTFSGLYTVKLVADISAKVKEMFSIH